jgi:hypothetical protein
VIPWAAKIGGEHSACAQEKALAGHEDVWPGASTNLGDGAEGPKLIIHHYSMMLRMLMLYDVILDLHDIPQ